MADYPGWVVGTYFGEPVFKNEPEDEFISPSYAEYNIHASINDHSERSFRTLVM